jgi:hypothetical protein
VARKRINAVGRARGSKAKSLTAMMLEIARPATKSLSPVPLLPRLG